MDQSDADKTKHVAIDSIMSELSKSREPQQVPWGNSLTLCRCPNVKIPQNIDDALSQAWQALVSTALTPTQPFELHHRVLQQVASHWDESKQVMSSSVPTWKLIRSGRYGFQLLALTAGSVCAVGAISRFHAADQLGSLHDLLSGAV